MPESYAASVNPPRRAKRAPIIESPPSTASSTSESGQMRPYTPRTTSNTSEPADPPPPPAKRGRKPGPLSKSAREAQRRLNHSIIEKARRTKINDALASLRQLVPVDYGQKKGPNESHDDDAEDTDDDEGEEPSNESKAASKGKGKGKKEEKEKEFKLEILVRTVSFLQDLLKRVATLEATTSIPPVQAQSSCQNCVANTESRKRKHILVEEDDAEDRLRGAKLPRHAENTAPPPEHTSRHRKNSALATPSLDPNPDTPSPVQIQQQQLPPISSWLLPRHDPVIDPQLLPSDGSQSRLRAHSASSSTRPSPHLTPYLPSPPSSTHVEAIRTSQMPPHLSLGPVATASIVNQPTGIVRGSRTPEDETAASLLLQISASSPPFRPARDDRRNSRGSLLDPSAFLLHGPSACERSQGPSQRAERNGGEVHQVQTPSSMLGLHSVLNNTKY